MKMTELSLADAVGHGWGELEGLEDELQERLDNMPENLRSGQVASALEDAIGIFECMNEPEVPSCLETLSVRYSEPHQKRKLSRPKRRDNATAALQAAMSAAEEWMNDNPDSADFDTVEVFYNDLDGLINEAESIDFPGMFG